MIDGAKCAEMSQIFDHFYLEDFDLAKLVRNKQQSDADCPSFVNKLRLQD